jgi:DNA polymerase III epsilon subunit-like protein
MQKWTQTDMFSPQVSLFDPRAKYAVLDLETGGTDAAKSAICSVAVVRVDEKFEEVDRYYTLVIDTPDKVIEEEALRINGLTREQIASEGKPWAEVFETIKGLMQGCIPVAHNAQFDYKFLKLRGFDVGNAVCTMETSWKVWPSQKAKLAIVYQRMYGQSFEGAHNSLYDVLATIELMKGFYQKNPALLIPAPINWTRFR